jgi:hypothetical protein
VNRVLAIWRCDGIPVDEEIWYRAWMIDRDPIRERFSTLGPHPSERECRVFAASAANTDNNAAK